MNVNDTRGWLSIYLQELGGGPIFNTADMLPAQSGAYLLLMELAKPLELAIVTLAPIILQTGWYIYAGNANGPGGMRARAHRHLRRNKICHWHVDHLTKAAKTLYVAGVPNGNECDLIGNLLNRPQFRIAENGFGSTESPVNNSDAVDLHSVSADLK